jgi:hypothetical protein
VRPYILHARWNICHREGTMPYFNTQFTHQFKKLMGWDHYHGDKMLFIFPLNYLVYVFLITFYNMFLEPGWHSRYNNWLCAGWQKNENWSRGSNKNFLFSMSCTPVLGPTKPPIQWVLGAFSLRVKRLGRESDHWPQTSAKVRKTWINTSSALPYTLMTQCLIS